MPAWPSRSMAMHIRHLRPCHSNHLTSSKHLRRPRFSRPSPFYVGFRALADLAGCLYAAGALIGRQICGQ